MQKQYNYCVSLHQHHRKEVKLTLNPSKDWNFLHHMSVKSSHRSNTELLPWGFLVTMLPVYISISQCFLKEKRAKKVLWLSSSIPVAERMCRASTSPARQQLGASHMSSGDSWKLCVPTARKQAVLGHCVNLPVTHWMLLQGPKPEGRSLSQLTKPSFMFSWEVGDPSFTLTDPLFQWCFSSRSQLGENISRADCCFQDTLWGSGQTETLTNCQKRRISTRLDPCLQSCSHSYNLLPHASVGREAQKDRVLLGPVKDEKYCVFFT